MIVSEMDGRTRFMSRISRRTALAGLAVPFALSGAARAAVTQSKISFQAPAGAVDCHIHILPDPKEFPFWEGRTFTPSISTPMESIAVHKALGVNRVVIVHPSFYGADMRSTLHGLRVLGSKRSRGVAVIDENTTSAAMDDMHKAGVRGVRLNFQTFAMAGRQIDVGAVRRQFLSTIEQIRQRPWHIQLFTNLSIIQALEADIRSSPVPISIDHFGMAPAAGGVSQPGFGTLVSLVAGGTYVKASGPYRISSLPNNYSDVAPLAKALISANPERIIWGSDWPHPPGVPQPGISPKEPAPMLDLDNGLLLNLLADWATTQALRKAILTDNAARLYDF
jgi:predicted TIM-barrel fold metal-dependent hydrolase